MNTETVKEIEKIKEKVIPLLQNNGVIRAGLFGSVIRGETKKESDIDILVEFPENLHLSLIDFAGIIIEIEKKLNRKVDLIKYSNIHPLLKDDILKEEVRIL